MQGSCKILAFVSVLNNLKLASVRMSKLCYGYKLRFCCKPQQNALGKDKKRRGARCSNDILHE